MAEQGSSSRYDAVARASAEVVIERYSTSFGLATRLLHEGVRSDVRCIYAMVRVADEVVDDLTLPWTGEQRAQLLEGMESEIHRAIALRGSTNLVVHAFAQTAVRHGIGADLIGPFFDSMRADLSVRVHDSDSLAEYVYGSAEVVGLMCLRVFVAGDEECYERLAPAARSLGCAFQKVNFLRDLQADHHGLGRTYFPDLDPAQFTDAHRDRLLDEIDADLQVAEAAIAELPPTCRRAVHAAHALFAALSRRLRATPAAEIARSRVRVPDVVKAGIVARSLVVTR